MWLSFWFILLQFFWFIYGLCMVYLWFIYWGYLCSVVIYYGKYCSYLLRLYIIGLIKNLNECFLKNYKNLLKILFSNLYNMEKNN